MPHGRLILMLIGLCALSACEANDRQQGAGNGVDVSANLNGQNGAVKIEGKFRLPGIKLGNEDVDIDGVRLYPGARVTKVDIAGEDGRSEGGVTVSFDVDAKPAAIRDYYLAAFKEKGVKATAKGNNIAGSDHDGKAFSILLAPQGDGTRGVMRLGSKPG